MLPHTYYSILANVMEFPWGRLHLLKIPHAQKKDIKFYRLPMDEVLHSNDIFKDVHFDGLTGFWKL